MDIDIDICPSKRPEILRKIKEERGQMFTEKTPQWAFGTEGTKSAILTACRGYIGPVPGDYSEGEESSNSGIDVDEAQYMASLIPEERGFLWPIHDVVFGNEAKGRRPVTTFVKEVEKYPGLLDIIVAIEGLVNKRSSHASGVILYDGDPFEHGAFMRTPKGEIITAYDLHDSEYMGLTKYDFLVTEVQDKLVQAIQLMQEDGQIEPELSLREVYDKYFHPSVLPLDDEKIWDALDNVSVINTFQFDSQVGAQVAKKLKPQNVLEMADAMTAPREAKLMESERICAVVIRWRLPLLGTTMLQPGWMSLRLLTRVTVPFMLMANTRDSFARRLKPPAWLM